MSTFTITCWILLGAVAVFVVLGEILTEKDRRQMRTDQARIPKEHILNSAIKTNNDEIQKLRMRLKELVARVTTYQSVLNGGEIDPKRIDLERNQEIRNILLGHYGFEKYMRTYGYNVLRTDPWGQLIARNTKEAHFRAVRVKNSSSEPDGSYKHYILRVPEHIRSPKEGIAWTFGLEEDQYNPDIMT